METDERAVTDPFYGSPPCLCDVRTEDKDVGGPQLYGLRDSALGSQLRSDRVPEWLEKWVALVLDFVEREEKLLPKQLVMLPPPAFYTPVAAEIEARGAFVSFLSHKIAWGHTCALSSGSSGLHSKS